MTVGYALLIHLCLICPFVRLLSVALRERQARRPEQRSAVGVKAASKFNAEISGVRKGCGEPLPF